MKTAELLITNTADRIECAKILVKAGYRVCLAVKKIGNVKKTFLVIDVLEEGKNGCL